ncbi:hypothetical protein [Massilia sp. PWRC2]|uniref:hypothetical protein n=1 Tax=Massilia sp. PWRC2 TaxID=2804626 RepID=UPI003CED120E
MQIKAKRLLVRVVFAATVVVVGTLVRQRSVATHATGWLAAGWVLTALMVWRVGVAVRRALQGGRQHMKAGVNLASIDGAAAAAMPPCLRGLYAMEKRAYRFAWRSLTAAPVRPAGPFGVAAGPLGGKRTASLLLTLALCAAAVGWRLPHHVAARWPLAGAYLALLAAVLYALVWIVGERRSLHEGGHRIAEGTLMLDLGLRASASVPLRAIDACLAVGGRIRRTDARRLTAGEVATVSIDVGQPFEAVICGTPQQLAAGRLLLYVDDAASFVAAVNRAMAAIRLSG